MKTILDRRAFLALSTLGTAGAVSGSSGCGLRKAGLPARTFLLKGPAPSAEVSEGADEPRRLGVLLVRPFKVATAFDSRSFVIRRTESEYVTDAYNGLFVSPGAMLTDLVAEYVRGLKVFGAVTTGGSQLAPSHALEGTVMEWYGDYREPGAPKAVLSIQFRLLHPLVGGASPLLWQKGDRQVIAIPKVGADELVAGWEEGLGQALRGLEPALFHRAPANFQTGS